MWNKQFSITLSRQSQNQLPKNCSIPDMGKGFARIRSIQIGSGVHRNSDSVVTEGCFRRVKAAWVSTEHTPSGVEIKKEWDSTSTPR